MKSDFALSLLSVLIGIGPFAHATEPVDVKLVDQIARELAPCVSTFDRPYHFYHYTTKPKIQDVLPPGNTLAYGIQNHLRLWSEYYWTSREKGGLYAASAPSHSRSHGGAKGESLLLYRIELPVATKVLWDYGRGCFANGRTEALFKKSACGRLKAFYQDSEKKSPGCTPLLRAVFARLGVRGFSYPYVQAADLPGCGGFSDHALVLFDLARLPPGATAIFDGTAAPKEPALRREAIGISKLVLEGGREGIWDEIDDALTGSQTRQSFRRPFPEMVPFKARHILGCEKLSPPVASRAASSGPSAADCGPRADASFLDRALAPLLVLERGLELPEDVVRGAVTAE